MAAVKENGSSGLPMKQDSEIAPRRRGGRRVNEFLNQKFSDLCELCASAVNTSSQKTRNSRENKGRITGWLPRLVGRVPATVHSKLLVAFLTIVVLLIAVGVVGLQLLSAVNRRARGDGEAAEENCRLPTAAARHHGPALQCHVSSFVGGRTDAFRDAAPAQPVRLRS